MAGAQRSGSDGGRNANPRLGSPCPVGKLGDDLVWLAIGLVDRSKLVRPDRGLEGSSSVRRRREPQDLPGPGPAGGHGAVRVTNQPMLATPFAEVLFRQISPTMRHAIGVSKPPEPADDRGRDNCYRNVRSRFHGLIESHGPLQLAEEPAYLRGGLRGLIELRRCQDRRGVDRAQERLTGSSTRSGDEYPHAPPQRCVGLEGFGGGG